MTAIHAYKEHEYHLIATETAEKVVKVAAIYGANASGKSNLCVAMEYFQRIISESFNNIAEDEEMVIQECYAPFSFEKERENSEFQIIEILDGFEYKYGFEYNDRRIVNEWMYRKNLRTNRTAMILERVGNDVNLGASVRKECDVYKGQIPPETLALSFFKKLKLKTDIFREMYFGIMDTLVADTGTFEDERIVKKYLPKVIDEGKDKLLEFLTAIDTGIVDIYYRERETEIDFYTVHKGKDDADYVLSLYAESEGTVKSIGIFIYARIAVSDNKSMFVDELNVRLHPLLLKFIIDLFYEEGSAAQLIYTTHDTTLMDKKFFRRDQIWFVQKDAFGYSGLMALSDFKVRADASFEKDYLAGVYGGIPMLGEFSMKEGE